MRQRLRGSTPESPNLGMATEAPPYHFSPDSSAPRQVPALSRSLLMFALVCSVWLVYAGLFVYRASFMLDGQRWFVLHDDQMISMTYAKHLAQGHGLVWSLEGEAVEGFTNPLWVAMMTVFHLLGVSGSKIGLLVQSTGLLCLLANLWFARKLSDLISLGDEFAAFSAVLLTAFYYPLNYYGLRGFEVSALTLLVTWSVYRLLRGVDDIRSFVALMIVLTLGTLTRMDMVTVFVVIGGWATVAGGRWRRGLIGLAFLVIPAIALTVFRFFYFGDLLPNTYYVKLTGFPILLRISRGLIVTVSAFAGAYSIAFLIPYAVGYCSKHRRLLVIPAVFGVQILYSIFVGGDAWEEFGRTNRYVSIAMPLVFVLLGCVLADLSKVAAGVVAWGKPMSRAGITVTAVLVLCACLVTFNGAGGVKSLSEWLLVTRPPESEVDEARVKIGLMMCEVTRDDATIAVIWAGSIPYFSERSCIDLVGKCDKKIAKEPMHFLPYESAFLYRYRAFWPGHMKWDYDYSLGKLKPDVITRLWYYPQKAAPYLKKDYVRFQTPLGEMYFRRDSDKILWDKLSSIGALKAQ